METTTIQQLCENIRAVLESKKNQLVIEMRNYPTPVAGCDAQFNYLLEQRDKLLRDLSRLNTMCQSDTVQASKIQLIYELLQPSAIEVKAIWISENEQNQCRGDSVLRPSFRRSDAAVGAG